LEPGNDNLWGTLGGLYMEAGNNAEAARALDRSVAIEPSYSALTNLGLLKYQDGDYAAAAALQQQATQLNPLDFMVWANLGMALKADPANTAQARGAYAQAATRAEDYIAAQPNDARAIAALGLYRAELGDPGKARALLDRAEALGTQPGEVALLNAETLAVLGDLPAARAPGDGTQGRYRRDPDRQQHRIPTSWPAHGGAMIPAACMPTTTAHRNGHPPGG
ncbi:tetratricopeptide repeat protein, partial [Dokdonella sp.]|uniref:tetratricopeptide repeat protein n=1 Tax=Dokdonella sp. TaxID=2291710 RepID=UPI003BAE23AE